MMVKYFAETDTLFIEFKSGDIVESRDLDEDTLLDVDTKGQICAMTIVPASERKDIPHFSFEQVAA
ncbi:MAG: DUF2283 domain-containing protein [Cyanophyceae cyanobacterium]